MDLGIKGKRGLVCAASKGLGRGCAEALAAAGVDLVINARSEDVLTRTAEDIASRFGVKVTPVAADITTDEGRAKVLAALGGQADILVTHEAPSAHPHGFSVLDELGQSLGVSAVFHGHHHDCLDYRAQRRRLGFATFGVGLRGITDMHGRVLRAGELD